MLSHPCRFLNLRRPRARLTPHEFKRTRAARPRPDLGGDDLADLGPTCWCVGRISTYKHLSIGKAYAVRPKNWFVLAASGGPCGPPSVAVSVWLAVLVAASTGRRRGRPPCWRPSVVAGVLAGGPCRWRPSAVLAVGPWLVSVRGRGGRFRGRWRPFGRRSVRWAAVVLSWPVAARVGLVCLPCQSVVFPPPLASVAAGVRCWCLRALCAPSVVAVAVSLAVLAGVAGVGVVAPCPCPWSVSLAVSTGRLAGGVAGRCRCAVPCWAVLPWPSVRAGFRRGRSLAVRPSLLVCWCAVGGWRPFLAVFRGRGGPCGPSVVLVSVAGPCGPCGPCFWALLAGRVGLASGGGGGWRCLRLRWCLPISMSVGPCWLAVGRVRCFRGGGVRLPCLWSLLVSHQRRPWPSV